MRLTGSFRTALQSWRVQWTAVAVCLFVTGVYLYTSVGQPRETDEMIYITLAHKLRFDPSSYTLRATPILTHLARDVYDKPLFHHPPLVPALLRALYEICPAGTCEGLSRNFTLLSIGAHLLTILLVFGGWGRRDTAVERLWPTLLVLLSPIAATIATKVWLDTVLASLMFATVFLYRLAIVKQQKRLFAAAGVVLGLSLLTKFTAGLLLPILLAYHLFTLGASRHSFKLLAAAAAPAILLAAPWFVLFYSTYGVLLPNWISPTAEMIRDHPFVATVVNRSPTYYLQILGCLMPASLLALGALHPRFRDRDSALLGTIVLSIILGFTYAGLNGGGYQTRHILPAVPFLCVLAGRTIARMPRWVGLAAVMTLVFNLWSLHWNLYGPWRDTAGEVEIFLPW